MGRVLCLKHLPSRKKLALRTGKHKKQLSIQPASIHWTLKTQAFHHPHKPAHGQRNASWMHRTCFPKRKSKIKKNMYIYVYIYIYYVATWKTSSIIYSNRAKSGANLRKRNRLWCCGVPLNAFEAWGSHQVWKVSGQSVSQRIPATYSPPWRTPDMAGMRRWPGQSFWPCLFCTYCFPSIHCIPCIFILY